MKNIAGLFLVFTFFLASAQTYAEQSATPSAATQTAPENEESPGEFRDCPECPTMVPIPQSNFAVGKYDVTFDEWDACVAAGGCNGYKPSDNGWGRANRPVINVNWDDAQAYISWLAAKTGKPYRLPIEQEWEFAARGGTTTDFYWGNDVGHNFANCNGCGSRWDGKQTSPVGSFEANPFGLYDMLGNVWQWTDSCWEGDCSRRILRGGSWFYFPVVLHITTRNGKEASFRYYGVGFRPALTLK